MISYYLLFDPQQLSKCRKLVATLPGRPKILCAFPRHFIDDDLVDDEDLVLVGREVNLDLVEMSRIARDVVLSFYEETAISGENLSGAEFGAGTPLFKAYDNELLEYTLNEFVYILTSVSRFLDGVSVDKIYLNCGKFQTPFIPTWYNQKMLLPYDRVLAPLFARNFKDQWHIEFTPLGLPIWSTFKLSIRDLIIVSFFFTSRLIDIVTQSRFQKVSGSTKPAFVVHVRSGAQFRAIKTICDTIEEIGNAKILIIYDESLAKRDTALSLYKTDFDRISVSKLGGFGTLFSALSRYVFNRMRLSLGPDVLSSSAETVYRSGELDFLRTLEFRRALVHSMSEFWFSGYFFATAVTKLHRRHNFANLVTLSCVDRWGNLLGGLGQSLGFRTVNIQSFIIDPWYFPTPCSLYDLHLATSQSERDQLVGVGADEKRIRVIPDLALLDLRAAESGLSRGDRSKYDKRREIGLDTDGPVLAFGTQSDRVGDSALNFGMFDVARRFAQDHREFTVVCKIHPNDRADAYREKQAEFASDGIILKFIEKYSFDDFILAVDLYMSRFSNTLLQAVAARRVCLALIEPFESRKLNIEDMPYFKNGTVPILNSREGAVDWLVSVADNEGRERELVRQQAKFLANYSDIGDVSIKTLLNDIFYASSKIDKGRSVSDYGLR